MSDQSFPQPPTPLETAKLAAQVRALMPLIGGGLVAVGIVSPWLQNLTDAQISGYVYVGQVVAGLGLYLWAAFWANRQKDAQAAEKRRAEVAAAVASADLGMPVTVTVTPPGQANEAVKISGVEQLAAPLVPSNVAPSPGP